MHTDDEDRDAVFYAGNHMAESCVVGHGLEEDSPCVMSELNDITNEVKLR